MARRLTRSINSGFHPTYVSGYPIFAYGGYPELSFQNRMEMDKYLKKFGGRLYDDGGYLQSLGATVYDPQEDPYLDTSTLDPMNLKSVKSKNPITVGSYDSFGNVIGDTVDTITSLKNRPYEKKSVTGGVARGAAAGATAGTMIMPGIGTAVGGIVGGVAGGIGTALGNKGSAEDYYQQQRESLKKQTISNLPAQHYYQPTFAYGGSMKGAPRGKATMQDVKLFEKKYPEEMAMGLQVEYEHTQNKNLAKRIAADHIKDFEKMYGGPGYYKGLKEFGLTDELAKGGWIQKATASIKRRGTEGVCTGSNFGGPGCPPGSKRYNLAKTFRKMAKNKAGGGYLEDIVSSDLLAFGGNMDNTTNYKTGGTHQASPIGGIPVGNSAVEEGEVRFDMDGQSYIFSNRLPYKKK